MAAYTTEEISLYDAPFVPDKIVSETSIHEIHIPYRRCAQYPDIYVAPLVDTSSAGSDIFAL